MLTASGVGHQFGERRLFTGVNVDLATGETLFIAGPSGSGKSTLLLILGGLLTPTEGAVAIPRPSDVAWVPQDLAGLARRRVVDNAQLYALIDGMPRRAAREAADDALGAVGLHDIASARAATLSGGENQRLCIARALASRRPIVLADEPTSQLDRTTARVAMEALHRQASEGRCVVVVTHDLDTIPTDAEVVELSSDGLRPHREATTT